VCRFRSSSILVELLLFGMSASIVFAVGSIPVKDSKKGNVYLHPQTITQYGLQSAQKVLLKNPQVFELFLHCSLSPLFLFLSLQSTEEKRKKISLRTDFDVSALSGLQPK
jgi:hypothetical protein